MNLAGRFAPDGRFSVSHPRSKASDENTDTLPANPFMYTGKYLRAEGGTRHDMIVSELKAIGRATQRGIEMPDREHRPARLGDRCGVAGQ